MSENLWFVDPTAQGIRERVPLARRPVDLAGKVVGLIDNTKEQADIILRTMAEVLCERYGVREVILERKEAFSKPASPAQIEALAKRVDVAATAVGG